MAVDHVVAHCDVETCVFILQAVEVVPRACHASRAVEDSLWVSTYSEEQATMRLVKLDYMFTEGKRWEEVS